MIRKRLPNRRACESFAFACDGQSYLATISYFDDGGLGEIFLTNNKNGSSADTAARDAAIAASLAFQHGVDVETLRKALCRDSRGKASGPLAAALDLLASESAEAAQ